MHVLHGPVYICLCSGLQAAPCDPLPLVVGQP